MLPSHSSLVDEFDLGKVPKAKSTFARMSVTGGQNASFCRFPNSGCASGSCDYCAAAYSGGYFFYTLSGNCFTLARGW